MTALTLSDNKLSGEIPADILSRLPDDISRLSLGNNALTGCVPAVLARACEENELECRSSNYTALELIDGTSAADQECGTLPECGGGGGSSVKCDPSP